MSDIKSPCEKLCRLDLRSGYCMGCKRSIEEIRRWPSMDNAEKLKTLALLKNRRISTTN